MTGNDQARVDQFTSEPEKLRVPYKCEECSEILEYDPDIAGNAIACPSCNSRYARGQVNNEDNAMMYPLDR